MSATTTDPLTIHRAVLKTAGPEALASITRPLTDSELDFVTAYLDALDAAPDDRTGVDPERIAEFRRLMTPQQVAR